MTAVRQLHENASAAQNIHMALCAAQAEIENPPKEKEANTGKYSYKYADIADVLETVLPVLTRHGISVSQSPRIEDGAMILKTSLTHGESETAIECDYPVCSLNGDHQKMGGALTYARRYALCTMVGVAPAEDLDGKDAAKSGDGDRKQMSSSQARKELNWDAIISAIRQARSHDVLDEMTARTKSNQGYWPNTYVKEAFAEINTRREELDYQARAEEAKDDPSTIATLLEECHTVAGVEHLRKTLIQVGVSTEHIEDEFELRKAEISS